MKFTSIITILAVTIFASLSLASEELLEKQFPEDGKIYRPGKDVGFDQYKSRSLFKTRKVVLTFDDGPDPVQTPRLLEILKKYQVKATFFMLSEKFVPRNMELIRRIAREGHIIASHHHDHKDNNGKTEQQYKDGLAQSVINVAKVLEDVNSPNREIYYRFPYGAYGAGALSYHHLNAMKEVSQNLFGDNCINFAFWDIDSLDWLKPMSKGDIVTNIMSHIDGGKAYRMGRGGFTGKAKKQKYNIDYPLGGGVVLMHDIHEKTVDIVPQLLNKFRERNIQVVPLNEVEEYSYQGKECRLKGR